MCYNSHGSSYELIKNLVFFSFFGQHFLVRRLQFAVALFLPMCYNIIIKEGENVLEKYFPTRQNFDNYLDKTYNPIKFEQGFEKFLNEIKKETKQNSN